MPSQVKGTVWFWVRSGSEPLYGTMPNQVTEQSNFLCGLEVNYFFSYDQSLVVLNSAKSLNFSLLKVSVSFLFLFTSKDFTRAYFPLFPLGFRLNVCNGQVSIRESYEITTHYYVRQWFNTCCGWNIFSVCFKYCSKTRWALRFVMHS